MSYVGETWTCAPCDAANFDIRQRCRFCGKSRAEVETPSSSTPEVRILSLLLHAEEEALSSIEDFAPDVLALQKRRIEELRHLHSQAVLAAPNTGDA